MTDAESNIFTQISIDLFHKLEEEYPEDLEAVMSGDGGAEMAPNFLGFVHIYKSLSESITREYTIIDLGCAYAPQCYYFRNHAKYIGVTLGMHAMINTPNSEYHFKTIKEFLDEYQHTEKEFAICSYVPNWGANNMELVKQHFQNVFTYYPCILGKRT